MSTYPPFSSARAWCDAPRSQQQSQGQRWYAASLAVSRGILLCSLPCSINNLPWEAPRGNGLSSVPFWCSEWSESAHPKLPAQSNPAEANGNLLPCIPRSHSRLTPREHNWPSCSASLGSEGLIRLNTKKNNKKNNKKKEWQEGSYLALKEQQKNLKRVCGRGQGAKARTGRILFTVARKSKFSLEALFK